MQKSSWISRENESSEPELAQSGCRLKTTLFGLFWRQTKHGNTRTDDSTVKNVKSFALTIPFQWRLPPDSEYTRRATKNLQILRCSRNCKRNNVRVQSMTLVPNLHLSGNSVILVSLWVCTCFLSDHGDRITERTLVSKSEGLQFENVLCEGSERFPREVCFVPLINANLSCAKSEKLIIWHPTFCRTATFLDRENHAPSNRL